MEIKNRFTGEIIYRDDSKTLKETVKNAVNSKCDLSWSNLSECDLRGSNLSECNLSWSDLRGSDLRGSDLSCSNLRGSDLRGSDLSECYGLKYAQMSFTGFGEVGRLITLADVNRDGNPIFFCGCFKGTNEELISYIEDSDEKYKESRHFARKTLLEAIKFSSNNKNK